MRENEVKEGQNTGGEVAAMSALERIKLTQMTSAGG